MEITWPTLTDRVRGQRIKGLAYDAENGLLRITLHDGLLLLVSSCREGCHVVVESSESGPRLAGATDMEVSPHSGGIVSHTSAARRLP